MGRNSRSRSPRRRYDDDDRERSRNYSSNDKRSKDPGRSRSQDEGGDSHRRKRDRSPGRDDEHRKKKKRDKSAERRSRKEEKEEKRKLKEEEARRIAELNVYSAADNPFNDANLGQQFQWHKKKEMERKKGITTAEAERREAIRRQEAKEELERLNRRRAEREVEARLREGEELRMARLQETAQMSEWLNKEGDFQLEQERRRAAIRIREKRAKAIDFLALNLRYVNRPTKEEDDEDDDETGLEIDLDEPYHIFANLTDDQAVELHDDIQKYLSLETSPTNIDFWTNMMVVCKDQLDSIASKKRMGVEVAAAVESDITALLANKTYDQLCTLQRRVQEKLSSGEPIDTDYWEGLLKKLLVWKAKAKLKNLHEVVVRNRLEQLRKRQRDEALQAQEELLAGVAKTASERPIPNISAAEDEVIRDSDKEPYHRSMSPPLLDFAKLSHEDKALIVISEKDDRMALFEQRRSVAASRFVPKAAQQSYVEAPQEISVSGADLASEAMYRAEAEKDLDEEEEIFNLEEALPNPTSYNWEDKWRPRKPRYFNRVHTGYEWNKYNQTHYDVDNPPPKVVQGYKFNIFYPDLIDKSKAPTYKIVKEPGNEETVLLHFSAGPPYEDIAFRIVNRDWEYSHKRGFRSSFDRGCLSLWFNFRRNFYRK